MVGGVRARMRAGFTPGIFELRNPPCEDDFTRWRAEKLHKSPWVAAAVERRLPRRRQRHVEMPDWAEDL
jgi:hypothetical protein